ncbi:hypothetical protein CK203_085499 [Vitis vinifera]|uniref:Retrovirus-related Pol polyprotein from transposon TNT 1-94 n=1 Tax=Vitis vinifera TaxID=29760 RepID=A0A438C2L8_VITVI|nr:hypothetical protein CK203_085499 [Vitis vinifera]
MVEVNKLKSLLSKEFDMKDLGAAKRFLEWRFTGIEFQGDNGYLSIAMSREYWRDDEVKGMSKCGEQASIKSGKNALGCSQVDFRYLRGTTDYDIMFNKQQSDPSVRGYVDADYVGDLDDRRIYVIAEAAKESLWLTSLVKELGINKVHTSENAADMLTKPVTTEKFKHCLNLINVSNC